jgi:S-DNA-T family DNA segregation ATPase FtsK/SpoIIIE
MTTITQTTGGVAAEQAAAPPVTTSTPSRARLRLALAWAATCRAAVGVGRLLLTLYAVVRLSLLWTRFAGATGLARQRVETRDDKQRIRITNVPRLCHYRVSQHGWTMRVKIRAGQALPDYQDRCGPLRHTAHAQAVKVAEIWEKPGWLEIRVLRRDPLHRVHLMPYQDTPGQLVIGLDEAARPFDVDFTREPHWLICGATDSGKSALISALLAALAPTDAVLIAWDLKFGLEAEPFRARFTDVATTAQQVEAWCDELLVLAQRRSDQLKALDVKSVAEAQTAKGVHFRRVYVFCDEVAELALTGRDPEALLKKVLRVVQLVRSLGIHVVIAGQRFGADLAKNVTAIRAQLGGRVCLRVNDPETAKMALPALPGEVAERALSLPRKGQAIQQLGAEWRFARCSYQSSAQIRALAALHRPRRLEWADLEQLDTAATAPAPGKD